MPKRPWPKLSDTLKGRKAPHVCQSCDAEVYGDAEGWREHDEFDRPTDTILFLCDECEGRLIEKHPRLYSRLTPNEPRPGSMGCCVECNHRDQLRCAHPSAKANGGDGILINFSKPQTMFIDGQTKGGKRWGEAMRVYANPPKCLAFDPAPTGGM